MHSYLDKKSHQVKIKTSQNYCLEGYFNPLGDKIRGLFALEKLKQYKLHILRKKNLQALSI